MQSIAWVSIYFVGQLPALPVLHVLPFVYLFCGWIESVFAFALLVVSKYT